MAYDFPSYGRMRLAEGLDQALAHTRQLLFRPFDLTVWLCLGVIIFIEVLFQGGGTPPPGWGIGEHQEWASTEGLHDAAAFIKDHLIATFGLSILGVLIGFLYILVATWLTSRGQLMFVRAVALGDHRIDENWSATRELSGSLFLFRFVVNALGFVLAVAVVATALFVTVVFFSDADANSTVLFLLLSPLMAVAFLGGCAFWLVHALLRNFVVPLMYHFNVPCLDGWRLFWNVAEGNVVPIILFFLIRAAIFFVMGIAGMLVGCFTCFIGFLPVIHQTFLAPLYVFERSYSLFVLESVSSDYRIVQGGRLDPDAMDEDFSR